MPPIPAPKTMICHSVITIRLPSAVRPRERLQKPDGLVAILDPSHQVDDLAVHVRVAGEQVARLAVLIASAKASNVLWV